MARIKRKPKVSPPKKVHVSKFESKVEEVKKLLEESEKRRYQQPIKLGKLKKVVTTDPNGRTKSYRIRSMIPQEGYYFDYSGNLGYDIENDITRLF
jgi:hypothetical protein